MFCILHLCITSVCFGLWIYCFQSQFGFRWGNKTTWLEKPPKTSTKDQHQNTIMLVLLWTSHLFSHSSSTGRQNFKSSLINVTRTCSRNTHMSQGGQTVKKPSYTASQFLLMQHISKMICWCILWYIRSKWWNLWKQTAFHTDVTTNWHVLQAKKHLNVLDLMQNLQEGTSDLNFVVAVSQS